MKKAIFCQTPYQLIVALCIKEQYSKSNDKVDLFISNTFNGYADFAKRISDKSIFNSVTIIDGKSIVSRKKGFSNIKRVMYILSMKFSLKKAFNKLPDVYDEMYCWNYDILSSTFRTYQYKKNKNFKCFIYDEGYISYFPIDEVIEKKGFLKLLESKNKMFGYKKIVRESVDGILLFNPEKIIEKPKYKVLPLNVNNILTKDMVKNISYIFNVGDSWKKYDKKFIIFEEAMLANNDSIDDEKIIDKIIEKVGKDNVIVKLHPRTNTDRFSKKGVKTLGSDGIPWEALALTHDFSDKVFISISSGSLTTHKLLLGNNMKGYLLFKLFDLEYIKQFNPKYYKFWDKIASKNTEKRGIFIPKTEDEFYNKLKEDL